MTPQTDTVGVIEHAHHTATLGTLHTRAEIAHHTAASRVPSVLKGGSVF